MEFWRLDTVIQKTGLSKSEIYRRMGEGTFPKSRKYPNSEKTFWLSSDVEAWQHKVLGVDELCR
jgi:prophage regulatory protein